MTIERLILSICALLMSATAALGFTSVYHYGSDEYDTIVSGLSPDGKYAITAHGEGDNGYDHFHIYLTDAVSGKKIGPLEEIIDTRDTNADAFAAKWSPDSRQVTIVYRVGRPLKAVTYRISDRRARCVNGPFDLKDEDLMRYWQSHTSPSQPTPRIFGTQRGHRP